MTPDELIERVKLTVAQEVPSQAGTAPRVIIDWQEYFRRFCEVHGKFPLMYKGRLLFPDGWTYSATDHAGPEWPPPDDEGRRNELRRNYWKLRLFAVKKELALARDWLRQCEELIATRSVTPAQRTQFVGEDRTGRAVLQTQVADLDVDGARQRVDWLERDEDMCRLNMVNPDAEEALA